MTSVLLFDGDCAFCSSSARWLQRWVKPDCVVLPYQHTDLAMWQVTEEHAQREVLLLTREDDVLLLWGGARAIAQALQSGVQPWPIVGWTMDLPGIRWGSSAVYKWVAANRHRLPGGTPACKLDGATAVGGTMAT